MRAQGFSNSAKNEVVDKLKVQIVTLLKNRGENIIVFNTTKKRKKALSEVVNELAPQYPELHFQVFEDKNPLVSIYPHIKNQEIASYTWVQRSKISNEWLVMAKVPGAWAYRCICVRKNEEKAIEIAEKIFPFIINMSLKDWITAKGSFQTMLELIPDDESIIEI